MSLPSQVAAALFATASLNCLAANYVRHQMLESDNSDSFQSQHACHVLYNSRDHASCLPDVYLKEGNQSVLQALGKIDEDTYAKLKQAQDKDINSEFINHMFQARNFESATMLATFSMRYRFLRLEYVPILFSGAYLIENPSFPEIHLVAVESRVIRLGYSDRFRLNGFYDFFLSMSVHHHRRKFTALQTDLLSVAIDDVKTQTKTQKSQGFDGAGSFGLISRKAWLPTFSLRIENATTRADFCEDCATDALDIRPYFARRLQYSVSTFIDMGFGRTVLAYSGPYFNDRHDILSTTASVNYVLAKLKAFYSHSPMMNSFGFSFLSQFYELGIQYTNEKQDNRIRIDRRKSTYVYFSGDI